MTKVIGKLNYDPKDKIGQGAFGTVFSGSYAKQTGVNAFGIVFGGFTSQSTPVAVKQIQMGRVIADDVKNEVKLMEMAHNHCNILKYLHFEKDKNFMYIATELCRGTLQQYITGKGYKGPKFESESDILFQISQGLAHLHGLDIVHRDINPNNILIYVTPSSNEKSDPQVKLADFGRSKIIIDDFTNTSVTNPRGTRGWIAPELYRDQRAGPKVDIFALGLIFGYTLSGGKHPFGDDQDKRSVRIKDEQPMLMVQNDLKEPYSSDDETYNLIKSMLMMNPDKRPTVREITNNLFFSPNNRQKLFESVRNSIKDGSLFADSIFLFEKLLIDEYPIDVNVKLESGFTLLHILCGYYEDDNLIYLVQLFVEKGADLKAKNEYGATPLHLLCKYYPNENLIDIVQLLLKNGAKANAKDEDGDTPLHNLCRNSEHAINGGDNWKSLVSLFEKNGASMDARDEFGATPNDYLILRKNGLL